MQRVRSQLHLQLGQEVIYVLMTLGLMAALVMLASSFGSSAPVPLSPDCALHGRGPCISQFDLPKCMQPGLGPCLSREDMPPDCALNGRAPCISQVDVPKCMQPGLGPCLSREDIPPPPPDCALNGRARVFLKSNFRNACSPDSGRASRRKTERRSLI
jgi:hypothetical protein